LATEFYSLHINCGGKEATIEGNIYEDDTDPTGPSRFYQSKLTGELVPLVTSWTMTVPHIPTLGRMQPNSSKILQHFTWMHVFLQSL
jgi:hypothetical protein